MSFCLGVSCPGCGQRNCPNESPISASERVWLTRQRREQLEGELKDTQCDEQSAIERRREKGRKP